LSKSKKDDRNSAQIAQYLPQFLKHGDSPDATYQAPELQKLRFAKLMGSILESASPGFSIHDVGCGMAHLHEYLNKQKVNHVYSGSDIMKEFVEAARRKFPDVQIECRDFLTAAKKEKYDFVVCNGILHFPAGVPEASWNNFAFDLMARMYEAADKAIAFNFLTTYKNKHDATLHYIDPLKVFDFCQKNLSRFVTLDHAYPLYEATVTVFTPEFMEALHSEPAFKKYFGRSRQPL
jgi:hypothetical protein